MDDKDGNGGESGIPGNPYISGSLCAAYRETMKVEINKITYTVKITGAVVALLISAVMFVLRFWGG